MPWVMEYWPVYIVVKDGWVGTAEAKKRSN